MGLMIETISLLVIGTLLGASQFFVVQMINLFPPLRQPYKGNVSKLFHYANMLLYNNLDSAFIPVTSYGTICL
jgi:hypothetical protein